MENKIISSDEYSEIENEEVLICSINTILDDIILQLSIINSKGKIIFDKYFKPQEQFIHYTRLIISKLSKKRANECCGSSFEDYIEELQKIFSKSKTILFYESKNDIEVLKNNEISLNPDTKIIDVMSMFSDMYYGLINSKNTYVGQKFHVAKKFYNINQNIDSIDTLKRAKEIKCIYDELINRQSLLIFSSKSTIAEEYAIKEFTKKIVMKYNNDYENKKFTIQDLNSILDNSHDLPKTVQQIILYTLQTNFCPNKIIYAYYNDPILHRFLDKIEVESCIREARTLNDLERYKSDKMLMLKLKGIEYIREQVNSINNDFNNENDNEIINNYIDSLKHQLKMDILLFISVFLFSLLLYFILNH